jgi:hypothetical protein
MSRVSILLAVLAATTATQASADVIFCSATGRATNQRFYTPFLDIGTNADAAYNVGNAFKKYLDATHPEGDSWDATCDKEATLSRSESRLDWVKYNNPSNQWIATGFTGGFPLASSGSKSSEAPSGAHLTVKSDDSAKRSAKAAGDAILQAQRDGAAALARRIADTAREQERMQAQMAKFTAELARRGRAQ